VAYRDDNEALRARVESLERELDQARDEIARMRVGDRREVSLEGPGRAWLGAPTVLRYERRFDGELSAHDHETVAELLEERFGAEGRGSVLGSTFRWSLHPPARNRVIDVRIKSADGRTRLVVTERLGHMAGGLFGGIVGGVGGGGLPGVVMGAIAMFGGWTAPLAGAAWILAVYGAVRFGFRRLGERRARELLDARDALERTIRERGATAPSPRTRVEDATGSPAAAEVEEAVSAGSDDASSGADV